MGGKKIHVRMCVRVCVAVLVPFCLHLYVCEFICQSSRLCKCAEGLYVSEVMQERCMVTHSTLTACVLLEPKYDWDSSCFLKQVTLIHPIPSRHHSITSLHCKVVLMTLFTWTAQPSRSWCIKLLTDILHPWWLIKINLVFPKYKGCCEPYILPLQMVMWVVSVSLVV